MSEDVKPRRRAHENLPGEAALSQLLPKGWTLLLVIGMGVFYASWSYFDIRANAEDTQAIQRAQQMHEERIRLLEKNEAVANEQRKAIIEDAKKQADDAKEDRRTILRAIEKNRQN